MEFTGFSNYYFFVFLDRGSNMNGVVKNKGRAKGWIVRLDIYKRILKETDRLGESVNKCRFDALIAQLR